jgi:hypothetical protein
LCDRFEVAPPPCGSQRLVEAAPGKGVLTAVGGNQALRSGRECDPALVVQRDVDRQGLVAGAASLRELASSSPLRRQHAQE